MFITKEESHGLPGKVWTIYPEKIPRSPFMVTVLTDPPMGPASLLHWQAATIPGRHVA